MIWGARCVRARRSIVLQSAGVDADGATEGASAGATGRDCDCIAAAWIRPVSSRIGADLSRLFGEGLTADMISKPRAPGGESSAYVIVRSPFPHDDRGIWTTGARATPTSAISCACGLPGPVPASRT